jgi:hypothetical protein
MLSYLGNSVSRPELQMAVHQSARFLVKPMRSQELAIMQIGRYLCDNCERALFSRLITLKGSKSISTLILLVDGVGQMQTMLIMFYQELDLSFVMPTVHCYGAANLKQKLHCQPLRQNILQCLMLCVRQSRFRTCQGDQLHF